MKTEGENSHVSIRKRLASGFRDIIEHLTSKNQISTIVLNPISLISNHHSSSTYSNPFKKYGKCKQPRDKKVWSLSDRHATIPLTSSCWYLGSFFSSTITRVWDTRGYFSNSTHIKCTYFLTVDGRLYGWRKICAPKWYLSHFLSWCHQVKLPKGPFFKWITYLWVFPLPHSLRLLHIPSPSLLTMTLRKPNLSIVHLSISTIVRIRLGINHLLRLFF